MCSTKPSMIKPQIIFIPVRYENNLANHIWRQMLRLQVVTSAFKCGLRKNSFILWMKEFTGSPSRMKGNLSFWTSGRRGTLLWEFKFYIGHYSLLCIYLGNFVLHVCKYFLTTMLWECTNTFIFMVIKLHTCIRPILRHSNYSSCHRFQFMVAFHFSVDIVQESFIVFQKKKIDLQKKNQEIFDYCTSNKKLLESGKCM